MTKYSDANILVISNKKTKREILERTKKIFSQVNAKITGVVVNKADAKGNAQPRQSIYEKLFEDTAS